MTDKKITNNKFMFICGWTCAVCGLLIFAITLFGGKPVSYSKLALGLISIFNGCVFVGLSRRDGKTS